MRGVLLDGGHAGKSHWSNQLACKDLESHMHKRLIRDVQHFKGRLTSYEVWVGALQWRDWIDRCGEALFHNAYRWAQQAYTSPIPPLYLPYISPTSHGLPLGAAGGRHRRAPHQRARGARQPHAHQGGGVPQHDLGDGLARRPRGRRGRAGALRRREIARYSEM